MWSLINFRDTNLGFRWIVTEAQKAGVRIVHLKAKNSSNHAIVIDGKTKQIIDSAQGKPLFLCVPALGLCSGV